jgi:hypothetical protein
MMGVISVLAKYKPDLQYSFSKDEYEHYMKLIKEIDTKAYNRLRECEKVLGCQCIEKAVDIDPMVDEGNDETEGYPIMVIESMIHWKNVRDMLKIYVDWYNSMRVPAPISPQEQAAVMNVIKSLTPALYAAITEVDPAGSMHIKRHYGTGASVIPSEFDGLPLIRIDEDFIKEPFNEQRFSIGHELGHYVIGHFAEAYQLSHPTFGSKQHGISEEFKKGKKVSGQLPFESTFEKAYQRTKEDEADRFAILELEVNINDGISLAKRLLEKAKEHEIVSPEKETFITTHPLWINRIKHLEELRREVEIRGNRKPATIDWKKLAEHYK